MAQSNKPAAASQAEVVLAPALKSCLVNLPSSLVAVLVNANTVAQNVIVELNFTSPNQDGIDNKSSTSPRRSVYLGWTGMQSQTKIAPIVNRDGIQGARGGRRQDNETAVVEIDSTFARMLGVSNGLKVSIVLHVDPPLAHTVHIEPMTPTDWDIIELHARFLEMNFLSQIRAIPNPAATSEESRSQHPLTLHLTPTSSANVLVKSIDPAPSASQAFVKIAPDSEVIVAPKSRQSASSRTGPRESRSVASTSRRSAGGRSTASTARHRGGRDEDNVKPFVFLRAVDRSIASEWFHEEDTYSEDAGLRIWVDSEALNSKSLKGATWVSVSIVRPAGLQEPRDPQTQTPEQDKPTGKVVAKLVAWSDAPDGRHAALSSMLCASLGSVGIVGGVVRIEAAPAQLPRTTSIMKQPFGEGQKDGSRDAIVKGLKISPFMSSVSAQNSSITFGSESKAEQERAVQRIKALFGGSDIEDSLFSGPLTHNMIVPAEAGRDPGTAWPGGILRFDPLPAATSDANKGQSQWLLGSERKLGIEMQPAISKPSELLQESSGQTLPPVSPQLVGIDNLLHQLRTNILHSSSVLLSGGLGSGKTSVVQHLIHTVRREFFYHTSYFPCRTLITDETRVSTIKETLQRLFANASWGARLGGKSLIVLDDLDRLCPVETELQVGGENGRNRQVSELLCSIVRRFCAHNSDVVVIATAQAKEAVHNVIIGGHIVRETMALKAPNKDGRRRIIEHLVQEKAHKLEARPALMANNAEDHPWMDGSDAGRTESRQSEPGFEIDDSIDYLDIAGQTDGYMAGDLSLLVSRARSEALIRAVTETSDINSAVTLCATDFDAALKGFTPASLRNVNLQSSTTTFSSIGGLHSTRQILLETLQYPTTYAPIFAQCPLRLRSGLLLYGFPGCGKTMLASAVAGECGLNFISVKGPEILNKYIGASEKSIRDLFERAQAARPCVLFFDEFDSIAPKRGHDSTGVTDRVVNQLLTQMDGAEGLSGVYVLAATSRPDLIDPALLRPGRLDKSLLCDMPDTNDRLDILTAVSSKLHLIPSLLASSGPETLTEVARRTQGYSGADLQAVLYNAHLEAIHDVLGPGDMTTTESKSRSPPSKHKDFTFFRLGDEDLPNGTTPSNAHLAERVTIAKSLADMEAARKRARAARHSATPGSKQSTREPEDKAMEPVINWRHIEKSLVETRASLSAQELKRLRRVYSEFVTGRSGELPDGQAGTEIGGRTSLM